MGLDGAGMDVLYKWCKQGCLSNIKKLINEGASGNLGTILPIHSFPAWTSVSTGTIPPNHGIYDVLLRDRDGILKFPRVQDPLKSKDSGKF